MPKFTREQIEKELEALDNTEASAAKYYLNQELKRRARSGRKATSKFSRKEQVRQNVANYRERKKKEK
jgi:hypothetical protein